MKDTMECAIGFGCHLSKGGLPSCRRKLGGCGLRRAMDSPAQLRMVERLADKGNHAAQSALLAVEQIASFSRTG